MEKETKEWGNKEQRAMLNTLRVMFPQVRNVFVLFGCLLLDLGFRASFVPVEMLGFVCTSQSSCMMFLCLGW